MRYMRIAMSQCYITSSAIKAVRREVPEAATERLPLRGCNVGELNISTGSTGEGSEDYSRPAGDRSDSWFEVRSEQ